MYEVVVVCIWCLLLEWCVVVLVCVFVCYVWGGCVGCFLGFVLTLVWLF